MKLNAIIFDLDGTLLNTGAGIIDAIKHTAKEMDFPPLSVEALNSFIGPPLQKSFIKHYGCDEKETARAVEIFRKHYKEVSMYNAEAYEGLTDVLTGLSEAGYRLGVATYKKEDVAVQVLKYFQLDKYFESIHGTDADGKLSKKEIIMKVSEELGQDRKTCVMVGDTSGDAESAREADVRFLAVTYGFGFKTEKDIENYPCIGIAETTYDIKRIIDSY